MKNLSFFLILTILLSCSKRESKHEQIRKIRFVQSNVLQRDSFEFKYIPLESKEECLIGMVSKVKVVGNLIFVFDMHKSESLFVFDMNGKFITKIGEQGGGPNQYISLLDFDIDPINNLIVLSDLHKECLLYYDLTSYQFKYSQKTAFYYSRFLCSNSNMLFYSNSGIRNPNSKGDRQTYHILLADSVLRPLQTDYRTEFTSHFNLAGGGNSNLYTYKNEVYIYNHLFSTIYKLEGQAIIPFYQIEFDSVEFPPLDYLKDKGKKNQDYTKALNQSGFITNYVVYETSDLICISIQKNGQPFFGLYNKTTEYGQLFSLHEYYKLLNQSGLVLPKGSTDNFIIGEIQVEQESYKKIPNENPLKEILQNRSLEDNPVLCLFKLKSMYNKH